ncbi:N-acetyltransferase [Mucilaginibacter sp. SG564]|uniref:N-acetyltransferase n=1 Tax=unclassified Mucilaginibacter TaxID=2617802 RepID=UPI001555D618|nr:N-acetyltransferase [Mucilaginibacter sp. SG564]NOW95240.1 superfamily II DNA or RNA helicase [Mucilaginibacter sp. SG564]
MEISVQNFLTDTQLHAAYQLWNDEYPGKLQHHHIADFSNYLDNLAHKTYFLLINEDGILMGWSATFLREDERWFAIILNSNVQGKKYGTSILNEIKKHENYLAGWVIDKEGELKADGKPYASPLMFYIKNGFAVHEDQRIESNKISAVKISWRG